MKALLKDIFYSFPIQLFILHFRKYQVLLVFWYLLGSTINSGFMKNFGEDRYCSMIRLRRAQPDIIFFNDEFSNCTTT